MNAHESIPTNRSSFASLSSLEGRGEARGSGPEDSPSTSGERFDGIFKGILVVGIGSPQGDDRAGWACVDCLAERLSALPDRSSRSSRMRDATGRSQAGSGSLDRIGLDTSAIELRKASSPLDLLDWLESDREVHLIDAASGITASLMRVSLRTSSVMSDGESGSNASRWTAIPTEEGMPGNSLAEVPPLLFESFRAGSSHRIELVEVMQLAAILGQLPRQATLWGIAATSFSSSPELSIATRQGVQECADAIFKELSCA